MRFFALGKNKGSFFKSGTSVEGAGAAVENKLACFFIYVNADVFLAVGALLKRNTCLVGNVNEELHSECFAVFNVNSPLTRNLALVEDHGVIAKAVKLSGRSHAKSSVFTKPQLSGEREHAAPRETIKIVACGIIQEPSPHDLSAVTVNNGFGGKIGIVDPAHSSVNFGVEAVVLIITDVILRAFVVGNEELKVFSACFSAVAGRGQRQEGGAHIVFGFVRP